jgi:hypothetical protein
MAFIGAQNFSVKKYRSSGFRLDKEKICTY